MEGCLLDILAVAAIHANYSCFRWYRRTEIEFDTELDMPAIPCGQINTRPELPIHASRSWC